MKQLYLSIPVCLCLVVPAFGQQAGLDETDLNAIDKNGDGSISRAEFDTFTTFAFGKMDKDGDNALSPDEIDDHMVGDAFNVLDDDGNGSVSAAEFSAQMSEDFGKADKDGDGQLN